MREEIRNLIDLQEMKKYDEEACSKLQTNVLKELILNNPFEIVDIEPDYIGISFSEKRKIFSKDKIFSKRENNKINEKPVRRTSENMENPVRQTGENMEKPEASKKPETPKEPEVKLNKSKPENPNNNLVIPSKQNLKSSSGNKYIFNSKLFNMEFRMFSFHEDVSNEEKHIRVTTAAIPNTDCDFFAVAFLDDSKDVKYALGSSTATEGKSVKLELAPFGFTVSPSKESFKTHIETKVNMMGKNDFALVSQFDYPETNIFEEEVSIPYFKFKGHTIYVAPFHTKNISKVGNEKDIVPVFVCVEDDKTKNRTCYFEQGLIKVNIDGCECSILASWKDFDSEVEKRSSELSIAFVPSEK